MDSCKGSATSLGCSLALALALARPGCALAQVAVPEKPPVADTARPLEFHDNHYGVQFRVPIGWTINRKDGEVSTFRLDARSASPRNELRSVVAIQFNPFPYSTFSGARFYYSVERHTSDKECARQATGTALRGGEATQDEDASQPEQDTQDIAGMNFVHGHDEYGQICVEARDEVYTAYRKGSCYRFDLAMSNFCAISSGAQELTDLQLEQIDQRMTDILSTVKLDWSRLDRIPCLCHGSRTWKNRNQRAARLLPPPCNQVGNRAFRCE